MIFTLNPYRGTDTKVLSQIEDVQNMLDDHIVKTQTMRGSPFIKPFEDKMQLVIISNCIAKVYCNYMYVYNT